VVLSTTRVALLVSMVVVALGIGLMGAVGFASPKDNDDAHHNNDSEGPNTLTVLTKSAEVKEVDLGAAGLSQGDMHVLNAPLYNESGKEKVGRLDLVCVVTDPADEPSEKAHIEECTKTFTVPGGQISAVGPEAHPLAPGVNPITGGTGKYAGVGGEERFEVRGKKVINTFHFIE
jgi:hypothetical protein